MSDESDSTTQKPLDFKPQPMCKWYEPIPLVRIAIDVFISNLFGNFADKREIQSALVDKTSSFNYQDRDDIWLDYVADLGDGFNSTYSIAYLLAQPSLELNCGGTRAKLERGSILMMGGDQVYPVASRENYHDRMAGPYQSALPWVEKESLAPHLFAIPGNHDWYDGLTSFTRQFCQQRWIGGWKTLQSTSYYAIQLPHRWWLFALDIQLEADIDKPQLDYFNRMIEQLQPGDSVILATAAPSWVYESFSDPSAQENINFIEKRIENQGAHIKLNLAGDLHHFAHYKNPQSNRHRITSGGGGAFLHGTHSLPDCLQVTEVNKSTPYQLQTCFPSKEDSKSATIGNLAFAVRNPWLCLFLSGFLLLTIWVTQVAALPSGPGLLQELIQRPITSSFLIHLWQTFLYAMPASPAGTALSLMYFGIFIVFCDPFPDKNTKKRWIARISVGTFHAAVQFTFFLLLLYGCLYFNLNTLGLPLSSGWHIFWLSIEMLFFGALACGMVAGVYLYVTTCFWNFHADTGFSSCHIEDFKNFLRLHIDKNGRLSLYSIGVRTVEKKWRKNGDGKTSPIFEPASGVQMQDRIHSIGSPIQIEGGRPV